ncbi:hypothetical protein NDU88_010852 [Pleurodeles waltl]|uniref:Uncharacterized protein n=1 Tax=Pleurodeles waltl TaxID=8319 RepID=A0AAV7QVK2_PLEWA|nr:hypothetical protein NDU88_010852 [Pleurodeles waltl]
MQASSLEAHIQAQRVRYPSEARSTRALHSFHGDANVPPPSTPGAGEGAMDGGSHLQGHPQSQRTLAARSVSRTEQPNSIRSPVVAGAELGGSLSSPTERSSGLFRGREQWIPKSPWPGIPGSVQLSG